MKAKGLTFCILVLVLNFVVLCQENSHRPQKLDTQTIQAFESKAKEIGRQWNYEAVNHSIALFFEASKGWKERGKADKSADCLREIVQLYLISGKSEDAYILLDKIAQLNKKHSNPKKIVKTISLFAIVSLRLGKIDNALAYTNKASKYAENIDDVDTKATALFTKGLISYENGEFLKTVESYESALALWKQTNDLEGQTKTLIQLAYAYLTIDEFHLGLSKAEEAFNNATELNHSQYKIYAQNAIGVLKSNLGKKQEALKIFLESEKLFPNEIDAVEKGDLYSHISGTFYALNELNLANKYRLKAFELYQKENYPFAQVACISRLGLYSFQLGKEAEAISYFNQGIKIAQKIKSNYYLSVINQDLGILYFEKNPQKSQKHFELALKYFQKSDTKTHIAFIQDKLGEIYLKQSNLTFASRIFYESLAISKDIKDKFAESQTLYNLTKLSHLKNQPDEALNNITQSLNITEILYSDVANSNLKRSYFSNVYDRYELYIHLLMQKHKESPTENFAIQALQASEKSRSRSLLETLRLSEANFTKDANPELVLKEKEMRNLLSLKADKLTELLSGKAETDEIKKVEDEIRSLENDLENVKAELKQNSPIYSAVKNPPPFEVAEFQQNILDDKTVLLEFSLGEKESYLWLIGKNEVSTFVLPARNVIENRVEKMRQTFDERQLKPNEEIDTYQNRMADLESNFNQEAKLLSQELLGQAAEKIKDKRLIIVPDGKLHYLPLSALPTPNSDELLIAKHEIVYQPSASTLNLLAKLQTSNKVPNKDLLVFADPVFSEDDARLTNKTENDSTIPQVLGLNLRDFRLMDGNGKIPRLFASQTEADSIISTIGKSRATMAVGYDANRERVLNSDISDYRILHFATHGLVDVERPEVSSIVLSQFDETGKKREGFLRLQDIYAMNLASDLVVLSACQSGVGKEIKGEGLMSLNNAFLQAGAKSVLSSAWKVDDNATAELMKLFYANLSDKRLTPTEALRQAQLSMSQTTQFKSPFYWAAFTVQGEFRQPISFSSNYFYYLIFAMITVILLALFWRFKLSKSH